MKHLVMYAVFLVITSIIIMHFTGCAGEEENITGEGNNETNIYDDSGDLEKCKADLERVSANLKDSDSRNLELAQMLRSCNESKTQSGTRKPRHHHSSRSSCPQINQESGSCEEQEGIIAELEEENQDLRDQIESLTEQLNQCQEEQGDNEEDQDCSKKLDPQPEHGNDDEHGHKEVD